MLLAGETCDRFVARHFPEVCRNGVTSAILRRTQELVGGSSEVGATHSGSRADAAYRTLLSPSRTPNPTSPSRLLMFRCPATGSSKSASRL